MLKGKGISDGIGIGTAMVLKEEESKPEKIKVEDVEEQKQIFFQALQEVEKETEKLVETLTGTRKDIMQAYLMILQDNALIEETLKIIEKEGCNAAYAIEVGFNKMIEMFEVLEDPYMAARSADIADMKKKILAKLWNKEEINLAQLPPKTILVTKELTTSDTAKLDLKNITGIITEIGGINSHMAIMARTHEIPLIVGIKKPQDQIKQKDLLAINGTTGEIFINPSKEDSVKLQKIKENSKQEKEELEAYKNQESITKDGYRLELLANIGNPKDTKIVQDNTAEGVGLFRSEFLYMNTDDFPTEDQQFEAYKTVAQKLQNQKVMIRTLDIGGDKELKYMKLPKEENPFLGYRAIRIFLDNKALFKVQLRAILRASAYGNLAIMLPMISSVEELRQAKLVLEEVKQELKIKNIAFQENIKIGIMIEIPSAALMAEELAKECDFFSIGTNDLIQYTIAVERGNEKVANLYTHYHPAIIRLIKNTIDGAHKNHILCGMCGEASRDLNFIPLLIGLGLDEFSMNPIKILPVRKLIRKLNFTDCQKLAKEILKLSTTEEIKAKLEAFKEQF